LSQGWLSNNTKNKMTKIVTDPTAPEAFIVKIDAQGHALSVHILRDCVQRAFRSENTFQSAVDAMSTHLGLIHAAAWAQFVRTRCTNVSLTWDDFPPHRLDLSVEP